MTQSEFQAAFEAVAPQLVGATVRYVRGDERVTDVWIYASFQDGVNASSAVYRVADRMVPIEEAKPLFGDPDDTIFGIGRPIMHLFFAVEDDQLPNSMVVHYNLVSREMSTEFSYERIQFLGDESDSAHAARWAKEFRG